MLVGALLFLASPWLSNTLYNEPGLVTPLRFVAFAIPPGALTAVALAACSGFRTMRPNALIGLMLDPILRLVLIVGALQLGLGLDGVLWAFVVIPYITCLLARCVFVLARGPRVAPRSEHSQIMRFASVAWVATFANAGLLWLDLLRSCRPTSQQPSWPSTAWRPAVVVCPAFAMSPIGQRVASRHASQTCDPAQGAAPPRHRLAGGGQWAAALLAALLRHDPDLPPPLLGSRHRVRAGAPSPSVSPSAS